LDAGSLPSDLRLERPDPVLRGSRASAAWVAWIEILRATLGSVWVVTAVRGVDRPEVVFLIAVVVLSALSVPKNRYLRSLGARAHQGGRTRSQWDWLRGRRGPEQRHWTVWLERLLWLDMTAVVVLLLWHRRLDFLYFAAVGLSWTATVVLFRCKPAGRHTSRKWWNPFRRGAIGGQ
jgi:hypothetical protein